MNKEGGLSISGTESKQKNHAGWFQQVARRPHPGLLLVCLGFDYGFRGGWRGSILHAANSHQWDSPRGKCPPPGGRARRGPGASPRPAGPGLASAHAASSTETPGLQSGPSSHEQRLHRPPPSARCRRGGAGAMPRGAGAARGEGKGFSRDWARFPVLWLKPVNMAAIGRGRSLKNLRIRGKPAAALTPHRPAPATPGTCLPLALGGGSEPGRWLELGLPPLACERILIGAVCLFRAGRNDSGEENVPLDLTRGNAGRRGRRRGRSRGGAGAGGRGQGRARSGPAGVREAEPEPRLPARGSQARGRLLGPIPLPGARFPRREPFSGPLGAAGAGKQRAGLGGPGDPLAPPDPRGCVFLLSRSPCRRSLGATGGSRGCYLGRRRLCEGRATTSCPPRPPEQKLDLLGSCCLLLSLPTALGDPQPWSLGSETLLLSVWCPPCFPPVSLSLAAGTVVGKDRPLTRAAGSLFTFCSGDGFVYTFGTG